ncbi:MAG: hypothetical protein R3C44_00860 [Chloroflexota bacterium]
MEATPQQRWRRMGLFALAYAALILSHNISAMIFTPFLLLYLALRLLWPRLRIRLFRRPANKNLAPVDSTWRSAVWPLLGLGLAFGLAAWFFFVPALAEQSLAH